MNDLTDHEMLVLNSGQLLYPSRQARAVGLALAAIARPLDHSGTTGRAYIDLAALIDLAVELVDLTGPDGNPDLDRETTMRILDRLERDGYITGDGKPTPAGVPVIVNTCTLPIRITSDDAAEDRGAIERLARDSGPQWGTYPWEGEQTA